MDDEDNNDESDSDDDIGYINIVWPVMAKAIDILSVSDSLTHTLHVG